MWKRVGSALAIAGLAFGLGGTVVASGSGSDAAGVMLAAVFGDTVTGSGPHGLRVNNSSTAGSAVGLYGSMTSTAAGSGSRGVYGYNAGTNTNVYGVIGGAVNGIGVYGLHSSTTGTSPGVRGQTSSTASNAAGVQGIVAGTAPGSLSAGVRGEINSTTAFSGAGIYGRHAGHGYGVYAEAVGTSGSGVYASGGFYGALTYASQPGSTAVYASGNGRGIDAYSEATTGTAYGVFGDADSAGGGTGVHGRADAGTGENYGVRGEVYSTDGYGGYFQNLTSGNNGAGVVGFSSGATASGGPAGFFAGGGEFTGGNGVIGVTDRASGYGVLGIQGPGAYAGYFQGDVNITGNILAPSASSMIDHPLDPANRTLSHSFVESPDMMNIYNGEVTLDSNGAATVALPAYFSALNKDFRFQLTAVGAAAPNLHIAQEVTNNSFKIAGGAAGIKVSWQVTGIRQDTYAKSNRIKVEKDKPASERGKYLYPEGSNSSAAQSPGAQTTEGSSSPSTAAPAPPDTKVKRGQ